MSYCVPCVVYKESLGCLWFHDHSRGQIKWQLMASKFIANPFSCAVSQVKFLFRFDTRVVLSQPFKWSETSSVSRSSILWYNCCLVFLPTRYTTHLVGNRGETWGMKTVQLYDVTSDLLCQAINRFSLFFTNKEQKNVGVHTVSFSNSLVLDVYYGLVWGPQTSP